MNENLRKAEQIGYSLAKNNPKILADLIDTLQASKYRSQLIEGLQRFEKTRKNNISAQIDYICKCGNCAEMEGFVGYDELGNPSWENHDRFDCLRCGDTGMISTLFTKKKHKEAPHKPVPKMVYERKQLLKKIKQEQKIIKSIER